ncbi:sensor histidine kinase [Jiulongibacter sediminis]|uniref:sensor histidine kinase n=1 Tax=Jiulongibacter sediminis TaxID=1605367 RepID=UPI0026E9D636|nr:ATP-binding protein [Jiulongibacter sediminis]
MTILFLASLISLNIIMKYLLNKDTDASLFEISRILRIGVFVLMGVSFVIPDQYDIGIRIAWLLIIGYIAYILFQYKENRMARDLMVAIVPFALIDTILDFTKDWFPEFWNEYNSYLDLLQLGAIVWIIAYWFNISRQQRNIKKEEEKRRLIEEENHQLEDMVKERTRELEDQKNSLQEALVNLKSTQNQLIQSEKLASLGELTAGIAHEIQNPLNFVNNFSEINGELLTELKEEISKGNQEEIDFILKDLVENEEKIAYHGKRADAIVKSMLQHSRRTEGDFEPTDINTLADEYLRLAYHGLRAKDKSFNANFSTELTEDLPLLKVKQQDIGRVILNLINNAFYAVNERRSSGDADYKPEVKVITKNQKNWVEIEVKDNGTGIPDQVKSKIFQPFFTSKPAGQGTGLGLSLSYDIITAGHKGKLTMKSKEGDGTSFIIQLPKE